MIQFDETIKNELTLDAFDTFPDECCGFLFGTEDGNIRNINKIRPVINSKEGDKRRRFEISPLDYLKAEQYADENNTTLIGIYHSHPNHPSIPSEHDRIAAQPFFSYVILSLRENELVSIQSWTLNEEQQFDEENVLILQNTQQ